MCDTEALFEFFMLRLSLTHRPLRGLLHYKTISIPTSLMMYLGNAEIQYIDVQYLKLILNQRTESH